MNFLFWVCTWALAPPGISWMAHEVVSALLGSLRPFAFIVGWIAAACYGVVFGACFRQWPGAIGAALSLIAAIAVWWYRRRRNRKRAPRTFGAKSRALRDALVRRAREAAKPRPVLRPAPGGARMAARPARVFLWPI